MRDLAVIAAAYTWVIAGPVLLVAVITGAIPFELRWWKRRHHQGGPVTRRCPFCRWWSPSRRLTAWHERRRHW